MVVLLIAKNKKITIIKPTALYKWAKNFKRIQDKFYDNKYKLRRLQQIEDFITLNNYKQIHHIEEVHLDINIPNVEFVNNIKQAKLLLVTHQGYSRYPCTGIIEQINTWLNDCNNIYLCLNRHYLNINNKRIPLKLPNDYQQAITSWLKQSLPNNTVVDLSKNYTDYGLNFTWSVPDRHYFISK
jgi:hypothetical protein